MTEHVRRSRRCRKNVTFYDPSHTLTDHQLRLALKKSKLEAPLCGIHLSKSNNNTTIEEFKNLEDIPECPIVQPSLAEFSDPIRLWSSMNPIGLQYGAVKLVVPAEWRPPFSLNLDTLKFSVREQKLHRLASGSSFRYLQEAWSYSVYEQFAQDFKQKWEALLSSRNGAPTMVNSADADSQTVMIENSYNEDRLDENIERTSIKKVTVAEWEKEYWRLVETQADSVKTYYAADIEVNEVGSGFPRSNNSTRNSKTSLLKHENKDISTKKSNKSTYNGEFYASHPWNLLNLPTCKGSLLKVVKKNIPGVTSPWLYFGMLFSSFCWHTEDNYFAAANYQHYGSPKVWYVIPPRYADAMQKFMRNYIGHLSPVHAIHSLTVQISPKLLRANSFQVYRIVQKPNEFVLLWPRTFHCGFNTGSNCNEACNLAPPVWLDWGSQVVSAYRYLRHVCLPFEQIIFLAASNFIEFPCFQTRKNILKILLQLILEEFKWNKDCSDIAKVPLAKISEISSFSPHRKQCLISKYHTRHIPLKKNEEKKEEAEKQLKGLSDTEFLHYIDSLSRFPVKDCSQCYISCYQGSFAGSDKMNIFCRKCFTTLLGRHKKKTLDLVYVYRFPFFAQKRLSQILYDQLSENEETRNDSEFLELKNIFVDIMSFQC